MFLGYSYGSVFDAIRSYRAKKERGGSSFMDRELEFFSLSTPLFEIEKYLTRPMSVTLRYNMAAFPGLVISLYNNRDPITNRRIVSSDNPKKAAAVRVGGITYQVSFRMISACRRSGRLTAAKFRYRQWSAVRSSLVRTRGMLERAAGQQTWYVARIRAARTSGSCSTQW